MSRCHSHMFVGDGEILVLYLSANDVCFEEYMYTSLTPWKLKVSAKNDSWNSAKCPWICTIAIFDSSECSIAYSEEISWTFFSSNCGVSRFCLPCYSRVGRAS